MPVSKGVYHGGCQTGSELDGSHGAGWAQPQEGLKEEHFGEWEQQVLVALRSEVIWGLLERLALIAFEKQRAGRQQLEGESQVRVSSPGQPKVSSHLPQLWVIILPFRVLVFSPGPKYRMENSGKKLLYIVFPYNDPFAVRGLVRKLSDFPELPDDNTEHSRGHSQLWGHRGIVDSNSPADRDETKLSTFPQAGLFEMHLKVPK